MNVEHLSDSKWISVPGSFIVLYDGNRTTMVTSTKGSIFVRDWTVLPSLRFMLKRSLVDVFLVFEHSKGIVGDCSPSGQDRKGNGSSIPCLRLELVLTEELLQFTPTDAISGIGRKEKHFIQNFVLALRSFPFFQYPEDLCSVIETNGGPEYLSDFSENGSTLRDRVFKVIKPLDWNKEHVDPPGLKCSLYKYQRKALAWMKYREGANLPECVDLSSIKSRNALAIRNVPIILRNRVLYFDFFTGTFCEKPMTQKVVLGGILCDEMGLGKTVEIIALILSSREEESSHRKSSFVQNRRCGGTLVVAPHALLQQWASEISNHAGGSLRVEVYNGIRHELEKEAKRTQLDTETSFVAMKKNANLVFPGLSKQQYISISEEMLREAHFHMMNSLGKPLPVEDPSELVLKEARRLAAADVVLTSFDVLKNEIHYDSSKNGRTLRKAKRYLIPDCALLKVDFFRMVVDEAQMIGSFSQVAQMTDKIFARKRWCVTGTPMISSNELADLKSLLSFLGLADESFESAWQRLIVAGLKPNASPGSKQSSWASLAKALLPVMWRIDKNFARSEFDLPPRSLRVVPLSFQAGEAELYSQLVEKARIAHAALQTAVEASESCNSKHTKRPSERLLSRLQDEEMTSLVQLRLACIHPQLTNFWRQEMSSDLQLGNGGTASMSEVLQRLVDKEQGDLQEAERLLCAHLNTLAMRLCDMAEASMRSKGTSPDNADRQSEVVLYEARQMLLKSQNVNEKGICAIDLDPEEVSNLPEPDAVVASSWSAWKRIQLNTSHQMIRVLAFLDLHKEKEKYSAEKAKRISDYIGSAEKDLEEARLHLLRLESNRKRIKFEILDLANKHKGYFDSWGVIRDPLCWWEQFERDFDNNKNAETNLIDNQASTTEISLGTIVISYLSDVEKRIKLDLIPLESWSAQKKIQSAVLKLEEEMDNLATMDWSAELTSSIPLKEFRYILGDMVALLTPFKRDTILSQYSQILPIQREVKSRNHCVGDNLSQMRAIERVLLEESLGYSKPIDSDDALILDSVAQQKNFIPSNEWKGRVKGYAFYMGETGLGYHADEFGFLPSKDFHMQYIIKQCCLKIQLELKQRLKSVSNNISGSNVELFRSCGDDIFESRLLMTSRIMDYLRTSKDYHVSSANFRLKTSILDRIEVDLGKAASEYPVKHVKQLDKLRKKIEHHKEQAYESHHKKAFMLSRLKESNLNHEDSVMNIGMEELKEESQRYGPYQVKHCTGVECPICLSDAVQDMCLWSSCGHVFCVSCNDRLFRESKSAICPICRMKCSYRYVLRVAAQKKMGNSRILKELDPIASDDPILASIPIKSDWSIKIASLVRRILALKIVAPDEKSLVFSQFTDALKVVSLALKTHEIQHVHLYGKGKDSGNSIKSFREDDNIKVFLIGQRAGAQGLTLVRANHVFLLEPAIDPAIEQQAISRVHRIGQQRNVHVNRFILKNTIEESILELQKRRHQDLFLESGNDQSDLAMEDHTPATLPTQAKTNETLEQHEITSLFDCVLR